MVSSGQLDLGTALLRDALLAAQVSRADESSRSEAAYNLAFGLWMQGRLDEAESLAATNGRTSGGINAARSIALSGWICIARSEFVRATSFFREALQAYASCISRDAAFHASVVHALANYDLLLLDRAEASTFGQMLPRVPGTTLDTYRLLVGCADAIRVALAGDELAAIEIAAATEILDVGPSWRVWGIALRARIASGFGHHQFARASVAAGARLAEELDWNVAPADSRVALLDLAEVLARYDHDRASAMISSYARIQSAIGPRYAGSVAPVLRARELHAKGIVALGTDAASGVDMLLEAATLYATLGYKWRTAESHLALRSVSDPAAKSAYTRGRAFIAECFARSHLDREQPDYVPAPIADLSLDLTPAHTEIIRHIYAGRPTSEIALIRGTSRGTIYNQLKEIYRRTGLRSICDIKRSLRTG